MGLTPVAFGTCPTSSAAFESENLIRVENRNISSWTFDCGFSRYETADHVYFQNEITFVELAQSNPYGLVFANDFVSELYTVQVNRSYTLGFTKLSVFFGIPFYTLYNFFLFLDTKFDI